MQFHFAMFILIVAYLSLQRSSMRDNNFPKDIDIAGSILAISRVYLH